MAFILSIETSTSVCSVALHDDSLIELIELKVPRLASSKLAVAISQLFKKSGRSPSNLKAVAVAGGPGSFTGLRIGVSTAKGICYSLGIPLIAVDSLTVLAAALNRTIQTDCFLCPMIDARRMEVYCSVLDLTLSCIAPIDARIIDGNSFIQWLDQKPVVFFGDGSEKCKGVIRHHNAQFVAAVSPSAADLGRLALPKFENDSVEDMPGYEPFYLKDFMVKKPKQG